MSRVSEPTFRTETPACTTATTESRRRRWAGARGQSRRTKRCSGSSRTWVGLTYILDVPSPCVGAQPFLPKCHQKNRTDSGTAKIKDNPTKIRKLMKHPVVKFLLAPIIVHDTKSAHEAPVAVVDHGIIGTLQEEADILTDSQIQYSSTINIQSSSSSWIPRVARNLRKQSPTKNRYPGR